MKCIALFLCLSSPLAHTQVLPVLKTTMPAVDVEGTLSIYSVDLRAFFGTEDIDDEIVRFHYRDEDDIAHNLDFTLFSSATPVTRSNFLNYAVSGRYDNSIIHRSIQDFVIQGGGVTVADNNSISGVPTDPAIVNEFGISNTLGTVSMAKLGSDPNSATSQWFVSLAQNSDNLDRQNGGFTVFGKITRDTMPNALLFGDQESYPIHDLTAPTGFPSLSTIPLAKTYTGAGDTLEPSDYLRFTSVTLEPLPADQAGTDTTLNYSLTENTNSDLVTGVTFSNSDMRVDINSDFIGTSTLVIRATDSVGNIVEEDIEINNTSYQAWRNSNWRGSDRRDDDISGIAADANNDRYSNLVHYAFGLTKDESPEGKISFSYDEDPTFVTLRFPLLNSSNLSYTIERATELENSNWEAINSGESRARVVGKTTSEVSAITFRSNTDKAFYRLVFSLNE